MAWFRGRFGNQGDAGQPEPEPGPVDYNGLLRELLTVELRREPVTTGGVKGWLVRRRVTAAALAERLPEFWGREGAALEWEPLRVLVGLRLEPLSGVARQLLPAGEPELCEGSSETSQGNSQAPASDGEMQGAEQLVAYSIQAFQAGNLQTALRLVESATQQYPTSCDAWGLQGVLLSCLGSHEKAIAAYDQALAIKPDDHAAWSNRGGSLHALGRLDEAISAYDQALAIKPDLHEAWYNRSNSLYALGRLDEAIASYDQALAIKPDYHEAWSSRGASLADLGRLDEAIAAFDQALAIKPDYHEAWYNRGNSLADLGRRDEAIASYDQALAIKPDLHKAWANRSLAIVQATSYEPVHASPSAFPGPALPCPALLAFLQQPPTGPTLGLTTCGYPGRVQTLNAGLSHCSAPTYSHGFLQRILGNAHWDQAKLEQSPRPLWRAACDAYNAALAILTATDHPQDHLKTLQALIRTHLALGDLAAARTCQTQGAQVFNDLRRPLLERINNAQNEAQASDARRALSDLDRQFTAFTQLEIDILIAENSPTAALEQAEFYKNRSLTWILDGFSGRPGADLQLPYRQIQTLLSPTSAALYWHQSPDQLTTFLLLPGQAAPIVFNGDRQAQHRDLETWQTENDKHYATYRDKKRNPDRETRQQRQNHPWRKQLATVIPSLQRILQTAEIEAQLPESITHLILIPHRDLHRLPLQALWSDRFTTRLLPSAQLGLQLQRSTTRLGAEATNSGAAPYAPLLNIDDPTVEDLPPLPFAQLESAILRSLTQQQYPDQPITHLAQGQATNTAVTNALADRTHRSLHFSGHGSFNILYPERSALGLSDGNLTARAIAQTQLRHLQFINLAACETAVTGKQDRTTEYIGLPSACLKAGAKTILSTLWNVDEIASCWFSIHFYQRCFSGSSPSQALHHTQRWMQNLTQAELITWLQALQQQSLLESLFMDKLTAHIENLSDSMAEGTMDPSDRFFYSPYYWAGFTITGQG